MSVLFTRRGKPPVMGKLLSDYAVGESVFLDVNGALKEFIVVNQGLPDATMYDASCDDTWLLMKDIYESRQWHSSNSNSYKASTIHTYLNGTFLNLFDTDIKAQIKTVKIPFVNGTKDSAVASGANGLSTKIFLLSTREVGWGYLAFGSTDGVKLSYFESDDTTTAKAKRIAYLNRTATSWWLRSPVGDGVTKAWCVYTSGVNASSSCTNSGGNSGGVRPALILPGATLFDPKTNTFKKGVA